MKTLALARVLRIAFAMLPISTPAVHGQRSAGRIVDITAGEYAIYAPDSVRAGVLTLRLSQIGDARKPWPGDTARRQMDPTYDFHMVWLVRLDSGRTASDLYRAEHSQLPTPWAKVVGGVGFASPPMSSNATMRVAPGNYALVCYVGSAREDRSRYHLLKGMIRDLVVAPPVVSMSLPRPTLTLVLQDDSIIGPNHIAAGRHVIAVRNNAGRRVDLGIRKLTPGATIDSVRAWRPRLMTAPPFISVGGVVAVPSKGTLFTEVTLDAGEYLFNAHRIVARE